MNWRRRLVSPKEQSTDASGLALCDRVASEKWHRPHILRLARSPRWVNRVVLAACQRLPVYPNKPAISEPVRTSRFANRGLMRRKQPISIAS